MQELREVVAQLRADDERLRQEQVAAVPGHIQRPQFRCFVYHQCSFNGATDFCVPRPKISHIWGKVRDGVN